MKSQLTMQIIHTSLFEMLKNFIQLFISLYLRSSCLKIYLEEVLSSLEENSPVL